MNWTGGLLSRHSTTAGSLKNRQKRHFDRVQTALRNGAKKTSPLKSKIRDRDEDRGRDHPRRSEISKSYHNEGSQLVPPNQGPALLEKQVVILGNPRHSSHSFGPPHAGPPSEQHIKQERDIDPDDDLYYATPPPRGIKRTREISELVPEMRIWTDQQEQESVSDKRRHLLRKADWVGVGIQRPLQLAFSPNNNANVGRRREITNGHQAKYRSKQSLITSPLGASNRHYPIAHSDQVVHPDAGPRRSDVRISIGERFVQPGISSSSRTSKFREHSAHAHLSNLSGVASSDVMLLDDKESLAGYSSIMERTSRQNRNEAMAGLDSQYDQYNNIPRITNEGSDEFVSQRLDESPGDQDFVHGWNGEEYHKCEQPKAHDQLTTSKKTSDSGLDLNIQVSSVVTGTIPKSRRLIFSSSDSSSDAPMQQPIPQSSKVSRLLSSGLSDIAGSTIAEVGQPRKVVPDSQLLDNETWQTWIVPSYEGEQDSDFVDGHCVFGGQGAISPGVSNAAAEVCSGNRPSPDRKEKTFEVNGMGSLDYETHESMQPVRDHYFVAHGGRIEDMMSTRERVTSDQAGRTDAYDDCQPDKFPAKFPQTTALEGLIIKGPGKYHEADELWRKFVFGSWTDEDDVFNQNSNSIGTRNSTAASSMIAHPPTVYTSSGKGSRHSEYLSTSSADQSEAIHKLPSDFSPSEVVSTSWKPPRQYQSARYHLTADGLTGKHRSESSDCTLNLNFGSASIDAKSQSAVCCGS